MTPNWSGVSWTTVTKKSGRTAETISEEMSVSRLQTPSSTTVRLTRGRVEEEGREIHGVAYPPASRAASSLWPRWTATAACTQ